MVLRFVPDAEIHRQQDIAGNALSTVHEGQNAAGTRQNAPARNQQRTAQSLRKVLAEKPKKPEAVAVESVDELDELGNTVLKGGKKILQQRIIRVSNAKNENDNTDHMRAALIEDTSLPTAFSFGRQTETVVQKSAKEGEEPTWNRSADAAKEKTHERRIASSLAFLGRYLAENPETTPSRAIPIQIHSLSGMTEENMTNLIELCKTHPGRITVKAVGTPEERTVISDAILAGKRVVDAKKRAKKQKEIQAEKKTGWLGGAINKVSRWLGFGGKK